uniref:Uncharacterized protein n=1 Tax=Megaselia scalaris TaxID=36166 RepID=T1H3B2_MEGSC
MRLSLSIKGFVGFD